MRSQALTARRTPKPHFGVGSFSPAFRPSNALSTFSVCRRLPEVPAPTSLPVSTVTSYSKGPPFTLLPSLATKVTSFLENHWLVFYRQQAAQIFLSLHPPMMSYLFVKEYLPFANIHASSFALRNHCSLFFPPFLPFSIIASLPGAPAVQTFAGRSSFAFSDRRPLFSELDGKSPFVPGPSYSYVYSSPAKMFTCLPHVDSVLLFLRIYLCLVPLCAEEPLRESCGTRTQTDLWFVWF